MPEKNVGVPNATGQQESESLLTIAAKKAGEVAAKVVSAVGLGGKRGQESAAAEKLPGAKKAAGKGRISRRAKETHRSAASKKATSGKKAAGAKKRATKRAGIKART